MISFYDYTNSNDKLILFFWKRDWEIYASKSMQGYKKIHKQYLGVCI